MDNKQIALKVLTGAFVDRDPGLVARYFAPDYIQHNPAISDGPAPIPGLIASLGKDFSYERGRGGAFFAAASPGRVGGLNKLAEDPNLWNDPQKAQKLMQERTSLEDSLGGIGKVERELEDNIGMIELGEAENDEAVVAEAEAALKALKKEVARRELEALLV